MILENASKNGELVVEWLKVELENTSAGGRRLFFFIGTGRQLFFLEQGGGCFFCEEVGNCFFWNREVTVFFLEQGGGWFFF